MSITKEFGVILLFVFVNLVKCSENGEYYWRPWTAGSPPVDALTGRDYRGVSYIVEAYSPNFGEFVGQAFSNQQDVNVSAVNVNTTQLLQRGHSIKVLCSQNKDQLAWYPTNYRVLENELITGTINPVVGGFDTKGEVLYVGRFVDINLRTVFFGSIGGSYRHHYHYNGKAYTQLNYEILIVDDKKCNS